MRKFFLTILCLALSFCSVLSGCSSKGNDASPTDTKPLNLSKYSVGDKQYINFGWYPQTYIKDNLIYEELNKLPENEDGSPYYTYNGEAYLKQTTAENYKSVSGYYAANKTYWFKVEPIRWIIVEDFGDRISLMSDYIIDCKPFNDKAYSCEWGASSLRTWLGQSFPNIAFNQEELEAIMETTVYVPQNTVTGQSGGSQTVDKFFAPGVFEMTQSKYGYNFDYQRTDRNRAAYASDYANFKGVNTLENGFGSWRLRSPGDAGYAAFVDNDGKIQYKAPECNVSVPMGVRPCIYLSTSKAKIS